MLHDGQRGEPGRLRPQHARAERDGRESGSRRLGALRRREPTLGTDGDEESRDAACRLRESQRAFVRGEEQSATVRLFAQQAGQIGHRGGSVYRGNVTAAALAGRFLRDAP